MLDAQWILRLDQLDRRVGLVGAHMRYAVLPVVLGRAAPHAHQRFRVDELLAVMFAGEGDQRRAAGGVRRHAVRHDLRQRAEQAVDAAIAGAGA